MGFTVQHYAADVVYEAAAWVDKNADKLTQDMYKCLEGSHDTLLIGPTYARLYGESVNTRPRSLL